MEQGKKIDCLNNELSIKLWAETLRPENKEISEKFPYAIKPQEVYMDKTGQKIVTLNLLENTIKENQVNIAIKEIQRTIRKIYPESIYHTVKCIKITEGTVGWFSFLSGGIMEEQLHFIFILPLKNRMMLGSYHFPSKYVLEETEFFIEMIRSIRIDNGSQDDTGDGHEVR